MGALRQARSFNLDGENKQSPSYTPSMGQSLPTLIVMIVVLFIIMAFCFWGAPAVRAFCRRRVCCCCPMDEPNIENEFGTESESTTPTIILLPYGRMLVVDRTVFAQLRATHTGIDFMELSANLIRAQRIQTGSVTTNRNILRNSDNINKEFSTNPSGFLPPAYEDIYGRSSCDLPPSYSEISVVNDKPNYNNYSNNINSVNSISNNHAKLRTFPSVPSIPNELKSKRQLLVNIKKKYSSLGTINISSSIQTTLTNETHVHSVTIFNKECTDSQNLHESRV